MTDSTVPRIGFVGLGGMGTEHARNVDSLGAAVVAGADVSPEARQAFADATDASVYENHEAMLDAESLDGVVVTTPNRFHEPATVDALERDVHVLCEKPLAHTIESAERIVAADRESEAFCTVGFCNRFARSATLYRQCRRRGEVGEVEHVEATYVRRRGIPGLGSWFTSEDLAGGGALVDLGVHALDLALHVADYPTVVEVTGQTRRSAGAGENYADPDGWAGHWDTSDEGLGVEDAASAFLRCANGVTISLEVAWATNRRSSKRMRVVGSEAGAEMDIAGDDLTLLSAGTGEVDHFDDRTLTGSADHDRRRVEADRFLDAVEADERPEMNHVEEGLTVQRVVDAIYRSAETGAAVRLDDRSAVGRPITGRER